MDRNNCLDCKCVLPTGYIGNVCEQCIRIRNGEAAGVVNLSNVVRQLPPPEDERIFKSMVSRFIKEYIMPTKGFARLQEDVLMESMAMEFLRDKIFEFYELRRRPSA
jgi:hypothetical protein